jgi:hypothetical protein
MNGNLNALRLEECRPMTIRLFALFAFGISAALAQASPEEAARQFYASYQKLHFSGLPNARQLQALSEHLSSGLQAAMRKAQGQQAKCIKANPGDKGPWVEGDMFTSNFEGFTKLAAPSKGAPLVPKGQQAQVRLTFEYVENGQRVTWTDEVVLVLERGRWVIDDVHYRNNDGKGFGNGFGNGLRASLATQGC